MCGARRTCALTQFCCGIYRISAYTGLDFGLDFVTQFSQKQKKKKQQNIQSNAKLM